MRKGWFMLINDHENHSISFVKLTKHMLMCVYVSVFIYSVVSFCPYFSVYNITSSLPPSLSVPSFILILLRHISFHYLCTLLTLRTVYFGWNSNYPCAHRICTESVNDCVLVLFHKSSHSILQQPFIFSNHSLMFNISFYGCCVCSCQWNHHRSHGDRCIELHVWTVAFSINFISAQVEILCHSTHTKTHLVHLNLVGCSCSGYLQMHCHSGVWISLPQVQSMLHMHTLYAKRTREKKSAFLSCLAQHSYIYIYSLQH